VIYHLIGEGDPVEDTELYARLLGIHCGRIACESRQGEGTTVRLMLPAAEGG